MINNVYKKIILFLNLLIISCGFHLKGTSVDYKNLPFKNWNIEDTGDLKNYLKYELLKNKNININNFVQNTAVIKLLTLDKVKRWESINRFGIVDDCFLDLDVTVKVEYNSKNYGDLIKLKVNRYMDWNNIIVGKSEEENAIWQNLYQEVAEQIINRIRYSNP